jgi:hypothetical protein
MPDFFAANQDIPILDFGSGYQAIHTRRLVKQGFRALAWEKGANRDPLTHCYGSVSSWRGVFPIVMASNVLGDPRTPEDLQAMLKDLRTMCHDLGEVLINYPARPRAMPLSCKEIRGYFELAGFYSIKVPVELMRSMGCGIYGDPLWSLVKTSNSHEVRFCLDSLTESYLKL